MIIQYRYIINYVVERGLTFFEHSVVIYNMSDFITLVMSFFFLISSPPYSLHSLLQCMMGRLDIVHDTCNKCW